MNNNLGYEQSPIFSGQIHRARVTFLQFDEPLLLHSQEIQTGSLDNAIQ